MVSSRFVDTIYEYRNVSVNKTFEKQRSSTFILIFLKFDLKNKPQF